MEIASHIWTKAVERQRFRRRLDAHITARVRASVREIDEHWPWSKDGLC